MSDMAVVPACELTSVAACRTHRFWPLPLKVRPVPPPHCRENCRLFTQELTRLPMHWGGRVGWYVRPYTLPQVPISVGLLRAQDTGHRQILVEATAPILLGPGAEALAPTAPGSCLSPSC